MRKVSHSLGLTAAATLTFGIFAPATAQSERPMPLFFRLILERDYAKAADFIQGNISASPSFAEAHSVTELSPAEFLEHVSKCNLQVFFDNEKTSEHLAGWMCALKKDEHKPFRSKAIFVSYNLSETGIELSGYFEQYDKRQAPPSPYGNAPIKH